ncbi:glycosyltransferase family 2 protein [Oceanimonas baumannii]|uniref:(Heptosyl)LPS beta-1,4-glucosyltransferase n=1 Tax=Oceanimonas baumannii TaxID=129578 RepID=A0A235CIC8_9GAMM|nr:glycosyltransferase family 2 protein [Oceanimonas baumannii]OYD24358.1 glycosyltransferase [Oceanimonas baumannii]TDW59096.1 (heptosyl)LPS beta-1,4-glucosyltransferase [Oceanimonas baumannii]
MSRPTLAAVLIVKNEAENLADCLATLDWVDEIVVMDSGSTDATQAVAEAAGARFFVNAQWPGFGPQRRLAQSKVNSDWVLWVDADERVTPELRASIEEVLAAPAENTVYSMARLSWVFGRFIRHCGWYPDRVLRLYPKALTGYNDALVHEKVETGPGIRTVPLRGDLLHYTYRDLQHYLVKSAGYASAWAEQRQRRGKKSSLLQGLLHGVGCFVKMYIVKAGFLDGKQGLLLSLLSAHSTFVKYADLWIRTETAPPKS